ncbi:DsbE family thiol:disulfide interchange protein [Alphaproteobacteria bacterium KMM 3653]|uniref:DsbE family thiol:disulfide interchange protein n=1 Tax=Harenicola maris TaxID=2841044 RepID=A0AAP2G852_9RHOB|nr:DsbE family thiol:disulfide interchange protein [Harenicola maris]
MSKPKTSVLHLLPVLIFAVLVLSIPAAKLLKNMGMMEGDINALPSALIGKPVPSLPPQPLGDLPLLTAEALTTGEISIVNYWASWCAPCREEHPIFEELSTQMPVYGINYKDDPEKGLGFLAEMGNPFAAVAADPEARTALDWGVYGVPETFIIGADGTILYRHPGQLTRRIWETQILPVIKEAQG